MDFLFSRSLIGNRLLSIRIKDDPDGYKIYSDSHPAILYFSLELKNFDGNLRNLDEKLKKSSGEVIGLRIIESKDDGAHLLIGLDDPISIPLQEPTKYQWKSHLISFFDKFQEDKAKIKKENEELTTKIEKMAKEYQKVEQELSFKNRENELLRLLLDKSDSKMAPSHCDNCTCEGIDKPDDDIPMDETSSANMTPSSSGILLSSVKQQPNDEDSSTPDLDATSQPVQPATATVTATPVDKNKSEELLWGVAQYIFCQLCPEQASDFKGMENHFINAHVDKEKRNCSACPSETLHDIAGHVQQHTSRVYACEFCGKRGRKHFLKSHIRTHTGERPYSCETCGRCFADASTLRRHRLVHSGVKAHSCPICGIGIARKDNVKVHIRSHGRDPAAPADSS